MDKNRNAAGANSLENHYRITRRQAVELWQTDGMDLRCREAGFAVLVHKLRMPNVAGIRVRGSPYGESHQGRCHLAR